jgi:hypothetical protein
MNAQERDSMARMMNSIIENMDENDIIDEMIRRAEIFKEDKTQEKEEDLKDIIEIYIKKRCIALKGLRALNQTESEIHDMMEFSQELNDIKGKQN